MYYDVLIIGSCTAGLYFAKRMAEQGYSVLVVDKDKREDLGKRLAIFHMDLGELERYGAPKPEKGDIDYVHQFDFSSSRSALGRWQKRHEHTVYVMKLPEYIQRLTDWADSYGAEFMYSASFEDLILDENGAVKGAKFIKDGKEIEISSKLVADCSGIPSVARRKLPDNSPCENFAIEDKQQFYVTVNYIRFKNKNLKVKHTVSYPYYKVWIAPCEDKDGAILGVGANISFDYGDYCLGKFLEDIKIPEFDIQRVERGAVPYRRPPYSFVSDGFVTLGDSACITKPNNGEGITAAWYLADIAAEEIGAAMQGGMCPTAAKMWGVNTRYQSTQGAKFAETLAVMTGAVDCTREENDYEFKNNIIFKDNLLNQKEDKKAEKRALISGLLKGVATGKIRVKTVKKLLHYSSIASKIKHHYEAFPPCPKAYDAWKNEAERLWEEAGSMADVVYDPEYYLNNI